MATKYAIKIYCPKQKGLFFSAIKEDMSQLIGWFKAEDLIKEGVEIYDDKAGAEQRITELMELEASDGLRLLPQPIEVK